MNTFTLLSIGAGFEQANSIQRALIRGYKVICVDGNSKAYFLQDKNALPKVFQEAIDKGLLIPIAYDLKDKISLIEIGKKYSVNNTLPQPLGKIITSVGFINTHFNFKGISLSATLNFTSKDKVNLIQKEHNLPYTKQYPVISKKEDLNYPLIIKPVHGSGSLGVIYVDNQDNFDSALEYSYSQSHYDDLIIEDFIEGVEFSVNLITKNNAYKKIAIFEKRVSKLPYRQEVEYFTPISIDDNEETIIADTVFKTAQALGISNSLINADVIFSQDKKAYVIDIAGRPGGNALHRVLSYYNTNAIDIWLDTILEDKDLYDIELPKDKCFCLRFVDLDEGIIEAIPNDSENGLVINNLNLKVGDIIEPCSCGANAMKHGLLLSIAKTTKEARSICQKQLDKYKVKAL